MKNRKVETKPAQQKPSRCSTTVKQLDLLKLRTAFQIGRIWAAQAVNRIYQRSSKKNVKTINLMVELSIYVVSKLDIDSKSR